MSDTSNRPSGDARHPPGVLFDVKITPRAARPSLELGLDGILYARVNAPPVDGAANKALLKLIASSLRIATSRVSLVSGHQSRNKRVLIEGLDAKEVRERLLAVPSRKRA